MRKVKVTLRPGCPGKTFVLFPDPTSLYVWACSLEKGEQVQVDGKQELVLDQGSFIEAELVGFEYIYDSTTSMDHKRMDLVRLGKANLPQNAAGLQVSTYEGWVLGSMLPMKRYTDTNIDVVPLEADEARIDLPALFIEDASE
jgi:hypothetical protein